MSITFSKSGWEGTNLNLEMDLICRKQDWTTFLVCGLKVSVWSNRTRRFLETVFTLIDQGPRLCSM